MRIIINESQYRQIIKSESNERLLEISVDEFLSAKNVIFKNYKKKGYEGIRLVGNLSFYSVFYMDFDRIFEHIVEIDGNLDLRKSTIKSLGNLESVGGELDLRYCEELSDLGNLKYVGEGLDLTETPIKSLGVLKSVGGYLDLSHTQITSLGDLEEVDGDLYLNNTSIESFGKLKSVEGYLYLRNTPISRMMSKYYIKKKIKVRGDISI